MGPEQFFLARFAADRPSLVRTGLLADKQVNLQEHAWVARSALSDVTGQLEPPSLAEVINSLVAL